MENIKNLIIRPFDYRKIKKCSECEFSNEKGICKFFFLYAYLRNGCIKEQAGQTVERETTMTALEDLKLSVRAYNSLKRQGIDTLEELQALTDDKLRLTRNLGEKCFKEVKEKLSNYHIYSTLRVFEINEGDIVVATSQEEALKFYNKTISDTEEEFIEELDLDTQGMWYPTEDLEDFKRIGKEKDYMHTPNQFGDLTWFEGELQKFTPYRRVLELLGEYTGPKVIASSEY